jgi:hypothetical protein
MSAQRWPKFRAISYALDPVTGWFVKVPARIAFAKMPERLKCEETQDQRIRANGAREVIHGPAEGGKWKFFTGMVPLGVPGWFEGNAFEHRTGKGIRSLVLLRFTEGDSVLMVFHFGGWYVHNRAERMKMARAFAEHVERFGIPGNEEGGR